LEKESKQKLNKTKRPAMATYSRYEKIILACQFVFSGMTYAEVGEELGISKGTITGYSKTQIWADEWEVLTKKARRLNRAEVKNDERTEKLQKTIALMEKLGASGLSSALTMLEKIKKETEGTTFDGIKDPSKRINALSAAARTYGQLAETSFLFLDRAYGISEIMERLQKEKNK
jgi:predicted transcriptional regulator